jgi:hypothetical protein
MQDANHTVSRLLDAALRLIAEDLCGGRSCEVGLFEHRNELRHRAKVLSCLGRHVTEINARLAVEPMERARMQDLWNSGTPFALVDTTNGSKTYWQLGGSKPGIATCRLASEDEYRLTLAAIAKGERQSAQAKSGEAQLCAFVNALIAELRTVALFLELSPAQQEDLQYQMRMIPRDKPVTERADSYLSSIAAGCIVLGTTIGQLTARLR